MSFLPVRTVCVCVFLLCVCAAALLTPGRASFGRGPNMASQPGPGDTVAIVCCGVGPVPASDSLEQPLSGSPGLPRPSREEGVFLSFHTLPSLFVHFIPPSLLPPQGKVFSFFLCFSHHSWCINPTPVDSVPRVFFFFWLLRGPCPPHPLPTPPPAAACLTGFVCKELSGRGRRGALS